MNPLNIIKRLRFAAKQALYFAMFMALGTGTAAASEANEAYRDRILGLIATHNVAYFPSLVPGTLGTAAGVTTYATNLALKYIPPYLVPPADVGLNPNFNVGGDTCGRQLNIPRTEADYSNFLGIFPDYPDQPSDWGALGVPVIEHANTDVALRVLLNGQLLETGNQVFEVGSYSLLWEGETLISYPLDYLLPVVMMYFAPFKEGEEGKEFLLNLMLEAGLIAADQFLINSTPHEVYRIFNRQGQRIDIYDRDPPQIQLSQDIVVVEALSPGGVTGDSALAAIQDTVSTSDRCDRPVSVFTQLPTFLPLGAHTVTWTALDGGPNPDSPRSDRRNETRKTQTLIVQDTMPPLLIPPADIVIESAGDASIRLGQPLVFDVVDLNPEVTCTIESVAVDCFNEVTVPVGSTEIVWTATDVGGSAEQATQFVTVKLPGTNTTPIAHDQTLANPVKSFDAVDIEITAEDADGDRLAFSLIDLPEDGFFVAPLYPYFIEDYRVEADPNPLSFEDRCEALALQGMNYFNVENPYLALWTTVNDAGQTYVYDQGYVTCAIDGPELNYRIAVFDATGNLAGFEFFGSDTAANDIWIDPRTNKFYMLRGAIDSFPSLAVYSADLQPESSYRLDYATGPGFSPGWVEIPKSVVVDSNGLMYVTNGQVIVVLDPDVTPQPGGTSHPNFVGRLEDFGDFAEFTSLEVGPDNEIYSSDNERDRIYRFGASKIDGSGEFIPGSFEGWLGKCTIDTNPGVVTHCDVANERSIGFSCTDQTCGVTQTWGSEPGQFNSPRGIAVDPKGVLYVTDYTNQRVQRFTPEGYLAGIAKSECASNCFVLGEFGRPEDITVNSTRFYILDRMTNLLHVSETSPIKEIRDTSVVLEYRSDNNFVGTDQFTFEASDGLRVNGTLVTSNVATVTIPVVRNDRLPIADAGITASTLEDQPVAITLDGNDPDAPLDTIEFVITEPPQYGSLAGTGANLTYLPDENFSGEDQFSFALFDGINTSAPESVVISVTEQNDAPVINAGDMQLFGLGFVGTLVAPFSDPDPDDVHSVTINWGDSTIESEGAAMPDGTISGPLLQEGRGDSGAVIAEHLYSSAGSYSVSVCVTDRMSIDANGNKTPTAESLSACDVVDITADQRALVLVDIETQSLAVNDGDTIDYVLTVHSLMPETSGGIAASNVVLNVEVDPSVTISEVANGDPQCGWQDQLITCTYAELASGDSITIPLSTTTDGVALEDRTVRVTTRLSIDEENLALVTANDALDPFVTNAKDVFVALNPSGDADGDGVVNADDDFPNDPNESTDTDGDGIGNLADTDDDGDTMPDAWETRFGFNSLVDEGFADADGDGLSNADEYLAGSSPLLDDTDTDGLLDGNDGCPVRFDRNQHDSNYDGRGDVCDRRMATGVVATVDVTGDGEGDYAVLRSTDTGSRLWIGNSNGDWKHIVNVLTPDLYALDMITLADADGSGSDAIAVLAVDDFGSTRVSMVDPVAGELIKELLFFDPEWAVQSFTEVPGSGESVLAVLASHQSGGLRIELRAASDGTLFDSVDILGLGWRPLDIDALDDGTLAVLAEADDGRVAVVSYGTAGEIGEIDVLNPGQRALALAAVSANGADEARYVVLAADNVQGTFVEVRDSASGDIVSETALPNTAPIDMALLDQSEPTLALLTAALDTGELSVAQKVVANNQPGAAHILLSNELDPRAIVSAHNESVGVVASDERGVLSLELQNLDSGESVGLLTTTDGSLSQTLLFNDDALVLSSGFVAYCDIEFGCDAGDFFFSFDSASDNPVVFNPLEPNEIAFLDGTPFDQVDYVVASELTFTTELNPVAFDYNDTAILRQPNGEMYKIGHARCFFLQASFFPGCVPSLGDDEVLFDWQQLLPDADEDGVDDNIDNCLDLPNPDQLDADGDGFGNACDGDLNNDCVVNFVDLSTISEVFFCADGSEDCANADLDGSGAVNFLDYAMLAAMFLEQPGPSALSDICDAPFIIADSLNLRRSFEYDLDTGTEAVTFPQPEMDFRFRGITSTYAELQPRNGTSIALVGDQRPDQQACLDATTIVDGVPLDTVSIGDWLCLRTNDGNLSRMQITGADDPALNEAFNIQVDFITWECDSCELRNDPSPLEGLVGWFDADNAASFELEGNSVLNWQDRSGSIDTMANTAPNQRPQYSPAGINGRGSVEFDGINDRLFSDSVVDLGSGYSIFMVARNDVRQNYNGLFSLRRTFSGVEAALEVYWQGGTSDAASGNLVVAANRGTGSAGFILSANAGPPVGQAYVMATRVGSSVSERQMRIDDADLPFTINGTDMTPNQVLEMCLGQGFGPFVTNNTLEGAIGEVLVFNRHLSDAEFDFVYEYINAKWSGN